MTIEGIVFDFDGLILDTETPEFTILEDIFKSYGASLPIAEYAAALGSSLEAFDPFEYLAQKIDRPVDQLKLLKNWRALAYPLIEQQAPLPGVEKTIRRAQKLGLKLAIASSSPRDWVVKHLTRLKLIDKFEYILTAEDVQNVKPYPDLYLKSIEALHLNPSQAIAFEDSPNGIQAAKAAGLFCIAVLNPLTRQLDTDHADLVIDSLDGVSLDEVIEKANHWP